MEVLRDGELERFLFPCPVVCNHLSDATKKAWLWDVDRSSSQSKLDGLVRATDGFVHEMRHLALLAKLPFVSWISRQFEPLKIISLALACVINLLLLLAYGVAYPSDVAMTLHEMQVRVAPQTWLSMHARTQAGASTQCYHLLSQRGIYRMQSCLPAPVSPTRPCGRMDRQCSKVKKSSRLCASWAQYRPSHQPASF